MRSSGRRVLEEPGGPMRKISGDRGLARTPGLITSAAAINDCRVPTAFTVGGISGRPMLGFTLAVAVFLMDAVRMIVGRHY